MSFAQSEMKLCELVRFYFSSKLKEHGFLLTCVHGRLVQLLRLLSGTFQIQQRSYHHVLMMKRMTIAQFQYTQCMLQEQNVYLSIYNVGCMM